MNNSEYIEASTKKLDEFLNNIENDIKRLNLKKANIFRILRNERTEIRHSNFLAWLFNSNETHGLEDFVLKRFLEELSKRNKIKGIFSKNTNYKSFEVKREKNNIDLRLVSEEEKIVICIENKIDSVEHNVGKTDEKQTNVYKTKILEKYPRYEYLFIYLTAQNESPEDIDWEVIDYQIIYDVLNEVLKKDYKISDETKYLIECYIEILKINYIEDKEFQMKCQEIYDKYYETWELVQKNSYLYMIKIYESIERYLEEKKEVNLFYKSDKFLSFNTKDLKKKFEIDDNKIFYSLGLEKGNNDIPIYIECEYYNMPQKKIDKLQNIWNEVVDPDKSKFPSCGKTYKKLTEIDINKKDINETIKKLKKTIDLIIERKGEFKW